MKAVDIVRGQLSIAVLLAALVSSAASAGGGSCCSSNGTPGCQTLACEQLICGIDPFCCNVEWDASCAAAANIVCTVCGSSCGEPGAGSCCDANGTPGCDNVDCCAAVCLEFAFCCDTAWDAICAQVAGTECGGCATAACCFDDDSCEDLIELSCSAAGGSWDPDGLDCANVTCLDACCLSDGSCEEVNGWDCAILDGLQLVGVSCNEAECEPFTGACCFEIDMDCMDEQFGWACVDFGGLWFPGLTCREAPCSAGACCFPSGDCEVLLEGPCLEAGGTFQGSFTDCGMIQCAAVLGACCIDGTCFDLFFEPNCVQLDGVYIGDDTTCRGVDCTDFGACCLDDGSCQLLLPKDCVAAGGNPLGGDCVPGLCPLPAACCLADDTCQQLVPLDCDAAGGVHQGPEIACAEVMCEAAGACCLPDGECLDGLTMTECGKLGGTPQGGFTACADLECPPPPGACCLPNFCFDIGEVACALLGGESQEPGTVCAKITCPQIGACCVNQSCVSETTEEECLVGLNGVFLGDGTTCQDNPCAAPGACCLPGGQCVEELPVDCAAGGGTPLGGACMPELCAVPCPTDTDGNGVTDVVDLVAVVLAWGTADPVADVNDDGIVDVQDLVDIVLAWGPCP